LVSANFILNLKVAETTNKKLQKPNQKKVGGTNGPRATVLKAFEYYI